MLMWRLFTMIVCFFPVMLLRVGSDNVVLWGFVHLRPFFLFSDSFFFLAGFQARWPLPSTSLLSLLASCFVLSLCCATYQLFTMPPKLPCQPLTFSPFLANRCLAMLPLFLSPSYSVASCRWRWSLYLVGTWLCCSLLEHVYWLGYHNISYLINASIYLVKGGRLGLMPGVLFHSCRPSFRHTGVMSFDFAFLTRLGDLWDPLDSSLWIKLLQQGPTLVSTFAT